MRRRTVAKREARTENEKNAAAKQNPEGRFRRVLKAMLRQQPF
jgi:hypothetical protein